MIKIRPGPGDDGYPSYFDKIFSEVLVPGLLVVFHNALEKGRLTDSMRSSMITHSIVLIIDLYHSIALMGKIHAKVLETFLPTIIHPDL